MQKESHSNGNYPCILPKTEDTIAKTKRLLNYGIHFGIKAQRTAETREHTDDEKECPRFSEEEGGWAWGKEIKGHVLTVVACFWKKSCTPFRIYTVSCFHQFR